MHNFPEGWIVLFHDAFDKEFSNLKEDLQDELFGANQRRYYKRLINVADDRYDEHLGTLVRQSKESHHAKKTR
jgi:hypothetical protein